MDRTTDTCCRTSFAHRWASNGPQQSGIVRARGISIAPSESAHDCHDPHDTTEYLYIVNRFCVGHYAAVSKPTRDARGERVQCPTTIPRYVPFVVNTNSARQELFTANGTQYESKRRGSDKFTFPPLRMIPIGPLTPKSWKALLRTAAKAVAPLGSTTNFILSHNNLIASIISCFYFTQTEIPETLNGNTPRRSPR